MAETMQIGPLNIFILTFNCARSLIDIDDVSSQLFTSLSSSTLPDLLVISLQEIAPIPQSFIGGSFLIPYFEWFHRAVEKGARKQVGSGEDGQPIYAAVAARNLGMTGIMVFAKDQAAIKDIEFAGVGVGLSEMGNKGATAVRFTYHAQGSSTELTFVSAHLAPMENGLLRRNEDWKNIVRGLVFVSSGGDRTNATSLSSDEQPLLSISPQNATLFKPTSHLFFAGDLNYRTSKFSPGPDDHIETFPQPNEDEASPKHYSALFEHDQLNQERHAGRTLHGLTEAEVAFPPTYKYDPKEPFLTPDKDLAKWHWASHRWPSWCDRILYLEIPSWLKSQSPSARIKIHKYFALPLFSTSDHRAVGLEVSVPLIPIPSPADDEESEDPRIHPPFQVNVDWKTSRERARILELVVGWTMYFSTTKEGGAVLVALVVGAVGAWWAVSAALDL